MLDKQLELQLQRADEHIAALHQRIADQLGRVDAIEAAGFDAGLAREVLANLRETLEILRRHRALVARAIEDDIE